MRHSDKKDTFETGAQRDSEEGKGCPSLISPVLIHRLGILLQKGAEHYGADNWMKGMKYRRTANSMVRHMFQWLACDEDEAHLAAIAFGVMCLITYAEQLKQASSPLERMEVSQDDRCKELKKILPSILTTPEPKAILKKLKVVRYDPRTEDVCHNCCKVIPKGVSCPGCGDSVHYTPCRGSCGGLTRSSDGYCMKC